MATAELFSPLAFPMLIEPNDWENGRCGGYILNEVMRGHQMVRRGHHHPYTGRNTYQFSEQDSEGWLPGKPFHLRGC